MTKPSQHGRTAWATGPGSSRKVTHVTPAVSLTVAAARLLRRRVQP